MSIDPIKIEQRVDQQLINTNIQALKEGAELISLLKDNEYTDGFKPAFQSTIGAHFRHVLEHYRCFVSQLAEGTFCYDKRQRDQVLECDANYALQTIDELTSALEQLRAHENSSGYWVEDEQTSQPVSTNLNRELLFLQSHSVHHYAIVGAMTRAFGNKPDEDFGVSIATRVHNQHCADDKPVSISVTAACNN